MSNLSQKALETILSSNNIARILVLLIGYFMGPYFGFVASNQTLLTVGGLALFAPTVIKAVSYPIRKTINNVPAIYNQILSSAVIGGGATYLLFSKTNLVPEVVVKGISGILTSASTMSGDWLNRSTTMIKYCLGLLGITLETNVLEYISKFVQNFIGSTVIENGSGILNTPEVMNTTAGTFISPLMQQYGNMTASAAGSKLLNLPLTKLVQLKEAIINDQNPNFLFVTIANIISKTKEYGASTSIVDSLAAAKTFMVSQLDQLSTMTVGSNAYKVLSESIFAQVDVAKTWLNTNIPAVAKLLAAAKTWLSLAVSSCYAQMVTYVGPTNAPIVCYCTGFIISAMATAWLTKRVYDATFSKGIPDTQDDIKCLEEFGVVTAVGSDIIKNIFSIIAFEDTASKWNSIPEIIFQGLSIITQNKCEEYAENVIALFRQFAEIAKSNDRGKVAIGFMELMQKNYKLINDTGKEFAVGGDARNIIFINNVDQASLFNLNLYITLMVDKISGVDIRGKRNNMKIFKLARATEASNMEIGVDQVQNSLYDY